MSVVDRQSIRRYLIELVVVVGGILIAFTLDAWWDGQTLARWDRAQLVMLEQEFEQSLEVLEFSASQHESRTADVERVLAFAANSPPGTREELPDTVISSLVAWRTSNLSIGGLDALLASGDLGNLRSGALRGVLAGWPSRLADHAENEILGRNFVEMVFAPALAGQGILVPAYAARSASLGSRAGLTESSRQELSSESGVTSVIASPELADLLAARLMHLRLASGSARGLAARIEEMLRMIRAELDR